MTAVTNANRTLQAGNVLVDFSSSGAATLKSIKGGPLFMIDNQSFQELVEAAKEGKFDMGAPR
jgi:hypothetical protein